MTEIHASMQDPFDGTNVQQSPSDEGVCQNTETEESALHMLLGKHMLDAKDFHPHATPGRAPELVSTNFILSLEVMLNSRSGIGQPE